MRVIYLSFCQMLSSMRRDMMLFSACLLPLLIGLVFRFVIPLLEAALLDRFHAPSILSPYYALLDVLFAMLIPAIFCFVSAMVSLEEADERTAAYLFVTPLGKRGYLAARFFLPGAAAFALTAMLLPLFALMPHTLGEIVWLAAAGTLQGLIVALLIVTLSSNKLEGMAIAKLATLTLLGAVVPFFLQDGMQYLASPLPSFWIGKAVFHVTPLYLLPAWTLSALWIGLLLKLYSRKI